MSDTPDITVICAECEGFTAYRKLNRVGVFSGYELPAGDGQCGNR